MKQYFLFFLTLFFTIPGISQENVLLDDFESGNLSMSGSTTLMGNANWKITDNPCKDTVNNSLKAYRFERLSETPEWAGFWTKVSREINADKYRYIHIKYLRTNDRSRLRIKLQRQPEQTGDSREFFSTEYPQKINSWEWMTFDLDENKCKGMYSVLSVQPDLAANQPVGTQVYIDDILLSNDPAPYLPFKEKTPQNLTIADLSSTSVLIEWDSIYGATSYSVYDIGCPIGRTKINAIQFSGMLPAHPYKIQVVAHNEKGEKTKYSRVLSLRMLKKGELAVPDNLHFIYRDSNSIELRWNYVASADQYEVYKNGELYSTIKQTQIRVSELPAYTPFRFEVKAISDKGERSEKSKPLTVATLETQQQRAERMDWWRHDRFGLFIHWGVYAAFSGCYENKCIPVGEYGEWIMEKMEIPVETYRAKAETDFTAQHYHPKEWVALAKNAGMKYIVITSKHHEGFALFDTKASDWNAVQSSPAKRDLLTPLVKEAHDAGLKVGFYYSQALDWVNGGSGKHWDKIQDARTFDQYLEEVSIPQVREILKNYGKIDILWWDMPIEMTQERANRFLEVLAEEFDWTKDLVINDRLGGSYRFDHDTPEQSIPDIPPTGRDDGRDWETCMTLNTTWGYTKDDHNWKSSEEIIHKLTDIVSKGGNFLLNIGPMADGTIPEESVKRLNDVGEWMKVNGEAIYGTTHSPFSTQLDWGRCTVKETARGKKMYFHVWNWPENGRLLIPGMNERPQKAYLLASPDQKITVSRKYQGMEMKLPKECPGKYSVTVVFEM